MAYVAFAVYLGHCFGQSLMISGRSVTCHLCYRGEGEKPGLCS